MAQVRVEINVNGYRAWGEQEVADAPNEQVRALHSLFGQLIFDMVDDPDGTKTVNHPDRLKEAS